jgi:ribonuclease BN (tRNA processing enzyme)
VIDSHCHLDGAAFDADRDAVLRRAREAGVKKLILTHLSRRYREKDVLAEAQAVFPNTSVARDFDSFQIKREE